MGVSVVGRGGGGGGPGRGGAPAEVGVTVELGGRGGGGGRVGTACTESVEKKKKKRKKESAIRLVKDELYSYFISTQTALLHAGDKRSFKMKQTNDGLVQHNRRCSL